MIRMEQEKCINGFGQHRADFGGLARGAEHHVQEIFSEAHIILRIHKRLADSVFVAHRRQSRHLGYHTVRGFNPVFRIVVVQTVMVERRQGANHSAKHCHRVCGARKSPEELVDRFVDHGVISDGIDELVVFSFVRQFTVQQQIASLQEVRFFRQLLYRVAAVEKDACRPIDVGDLRLAGGRGNKSGIVGKNALTDESSDINDIRSSTALINGEVDSICVPVDF